MPKNLAKERYLNEAKNFPNIRGFQKISLIDWDGKITSVIFLAGCNFRCGFCHSSPLVLAEKRLEHIPFESIESFLRKKKGWIDGVVITGGEPTLDERQLSALAFSIKDLGLLVKLDTNGSRPKVLKRVIRSKAIDYIAMDIKAPLAGETYRRAVNTSLSIEDIIASKDIILDSGIEHEFRTTVVPGLVSVSDIAEIAKSIISAKKFCLQQFSPRDTLDPSYLNLKPYPAEELYKMAAIASEYLPSVIVRKS